MGKAQELLQKLDTLKSERSNWDTHWAEIAPLVLQRQDNFFEENRTEGDRRTRKKFDDTATLALERGSAAIEGILIPRGQKWHGIQLPDELEDDDEANVWADDVRDFLFRQRYSSSANFASQAHEFIMSLLAFGTAVMMVEDQIGKGIRYKSSHLSEHYIMENAAGVIDTNFRLYEITARQAMERFGDQTPPKVRQVFEKTPAKKMKFLHAVMPDEDRETNMPFVGYHVSVEDNELIGVGGFKTFPYIVSRWVTAPNETYGRSPAMNVLAEIKMLNQIRKTDLRARHNAVDPPILAADQATIRRLSMQAGKINYGTVDANGRPLVQPYNSGTNINVSNDAITQSREVINDAFFVTLFQILVDAPQMTATEVLQRAQEKGTLLSPSAGRQMSEWLGPLIEREIRLYEDYGIFEDDGILPMPDSVKEFGGEFEIKYTNPITKMQQTEEALATDRTIQSLLPLAQLDPNILAPVDWKEYADIIREANGAPARLYKTDEVLEEEQAQAAQEAALASVVEAAPQVAGSIKDLAQAEAIASEG
jgi:hypothetical protein